MADSPKTQKQIEETVLEILKSSNMDEMTEYKVRKAASEKLGFDLSPPEHKRFVRQVVESYLTDLQSKHEAAEEEEEDPEEEDDEEEEEEQKKRKRGAGAKEYDDDGDLIVCRVSFIIYYCFFRLF